MIRWLKIRQCSGSASIELPFLGVKLKRTICLDLGAKCYKTIKKDMSIKRIV